MNVANGERFLLSDRGRVTTPKRMPTTTARWKRGAPVVSRLGLTFINIPTQYLQYQHHKDCASHLFFVAPCNSGVG